MSTSSQLDLVRNHILADVFMCHQSVLVNTLIDQLKENGRKFAVVSNDFGSVGVVSITDFPLLEDLTDKVVGEFVSFDTQMFLLDSCTIADADRLMDNCNASYALVEDDQSIIIGVYPAE